MDEVQLLQRWVGPGSDPSGTTITIARAVLLRTIEKPVTRPSALLRRARRQAGGSLTKVAGLAAICTSAIMVQPHTPLGLPGHRALGWLSLLLVMRLEGGTGCLFNGPGDRRNANPLLGALRNNGGQTDTQALGSGSPAIDAGLGCPATDQRGVGRPLGPACDIGAFEAAAAPQVPNEPVGPSFQRFLELLRSDATAVELCAERDQLNTELLNDDRLPPEKKSFSDLSEEWRKLLIWWTTGPGKRKSWR